MGCDSNHTDGANGKERKCERIVAAKDFEPIRGIGNKPRGCAGIARSIFEPNHVGNLVGHPEDEVGADLAAGTDGDVVNDDRQFRGCTDLAEMRLNACLRRAVVIRGNDQDGIHARAGCRRSEFRRVTGVVGSRTSDERNVDSRSDSAPQRDLFLVGQTGSLASRAAEDECIVTLSDKPTRQFGGTFMVEFAIGGKWGDHCGDHRTET
ncbi:unannotated protein [freshwater metagenome]|uniref:Unannotated protein n=1 Tax=freshwater metagenome TaxID=449393 RepID=A0A6J6FWG3_9ZZZZ